MSREDVFWCVLAGALLALAFIAPYAAIGLALLAAACVYSVGAPR